MTREEIRRGAIITKHYDDAKRALHAVYMTQLAELAALKAARMRLLMLKRRAQKARCLDCGRPQLNIKET